MKLKFKGTVGMNGFYSETVYEAEGKSYEELFKNLMKNIIDKNETSYALDLIDEIYLLKEEEDEDRGSFVGGVWVQDEDRELSCYEIIRKIETHSEQFFKEYDNTIEGIYVEHKGEKYRQITNLYEGPFSKERTNKVHFQTTRKLIYKGEEYDQITYKEILVDISTMEVIKEESREDEVIW